MSRRNIASDMAKLVDQYKASGQSKKVFAAFHGVSKGKLHYWIKKLSKPDKVLHLANESSFVPIEITPLPSEKTDQAIVIRLTSGVEIEIPV